MSVKSICFTTSKNSLLDFCLIDLSIGERGVLSSPTTSACGLMCALSSINISFTYVGAFILGAKIFWIETSSLGIVPGMCIKYPSQYLLIDYSLKSVLLEISMATPACFVGPFAWKSFSQPFILSRCICGWDVFLVNSRMLDPVFTSNLLACSSL